ncbi:MAG TPA: hypothetical protein VNZ49_06720 [Bacteroidia bacterium]|jgi:hypothetical protein|nr:hypothetical protein [Bacteroidia bacterium]
MSRDKMPISLLRNKKTIGYLNGLSEILHQNNGLRIVYHSLEKKTQEWLLNLGYNRLDLTEQESELLEQWSHAAYDLVNTKKELSAAEKAFVEQHEFFFKN